MSHRHSLDSGEAANRVRELAAATECITEDDLALLADVEVSTLEGWRKRGKGPSYILLGNRYLYQRSAVIAYLSNIVRQRGTQIVEGVL